MELFIGILIFIILATIVYGHRHRVPIVPSTQWRCKKNNLKVTILYLTEERVYFETEYGALASMLIEDFIYHFEEDVKCSQQSE